MKNMKTAAGMLCLAGILSLGMGTTVFAEDGDSHYPVTITTYNYENEPVEMTFEKAPEKVFAYANSNIEELLALGLGDKIVAAYGLDGDVREDLKDEFDKIQYMDTKPSKEEVVAMEPDFIAAWYSSFSDDWLSDVSFWQERDVNTYMSLNSAAKGPASEFPRTIEDEYEDILNLGKIFDCEDKAEEIVDQMKGEIDKVKEHVEGTDPLSVAVLEDEGDSFRVYGTETLGGNIPETLGAELKLGAENSENVGAEDLIAADPDVLFMINYDGFMTADEAIADITDNPAYASLSAVKNNKVFSVNLNEVYCSGVRTYDGIMTPLQYTSFRFTENTLLFLTAERLAYAVKNNKVFSVNLNEVYCSGVRTYDGIMTFAKALYPDLYE